MKCTSCGSNNLINTRCVPFGVYGDATFEANKDNVFICLECGHIELYNLYFVKKYKESHKRYDEINKELLLIDAQIKKLENTPFDSSKYEMKIKQLEDEIETLTNLGTGGKIIRAREDSIKDYKRLIKNKNDMEINSKINDLKNKRNELIKEQSQINLNS